jgi:hypothetical protein
MRDDQGMRLALRWWDTLRPPERIVAMSLVAGGIVAMVNSTVWAAAVCYMSRQRARAAIARADLQRPGGLEATGTAHEVMGGAQ